MREVSYVVALLGGLFLVAAGSVWWRVYSKTSEAEARAEGLDTRLFRSAAMLTSVALGVSGLAAIFSSEMEWERSCLFACHLGAMERSFRGTYG